MPVGTASSLTAFQKSPISEYLCLSNAQKLVHQDNFDHQWIPRDVEDEIVTWGYYVM